MTPINGLIIDPYKWSYHLYRRLHSREDFNPACFFVGVWFSLLVLRILLEGKTRPQRICILLAINESVVTLGFQTPNVRKVLPQVSIPKDVVSRYLEDYVISSTSGF